MCIRDSSAAVDSAMTELTPEMVAVISAAVDAGLDGMSHRIVEIKQSPDVYKRQFPATSCTRPPASARCGEKGSCWRNCRRGWAVGK